LWIAEGIETALSLLSGLLSGPATVWAALSTSGIKALHLPPDPAKLIIATDGDAPGREAGNVLASRASALGWKVSLLPAPDGSDWNDVLQSGERAA
jgi:DNA primase